MSNQSRKVREHLARLKSQGILLPEDRNPRQCWLLVVMHPTPNSPGEVFLTHGNNFDKFDKRPGFEIVAHGFDRGALTKARVALTSRLGTNYQPPKSNFKRTLEAAANTERSESQDVPTDTPDDFADAVGKPVGDEN